MNYKKFFLAMFLLVTAHQAYAMPLNLNDFTHNSSFTTVAADGSAATINEDADFATSFLGVDPFFGEPNIIIAAADAVLNFSYIFTEAENNDDAFQVNLFDSDNLVFLETFFIEDSGSGTVSFDLSSYVGLTLGLSFDLRAFDFLLGSSAEVFDVSITTLVTAVSESGVLSLFVVAFLVLGLSVLTSLKRQR